MSNAEAFEQFFGNERRFVAIAWNSGFCAESSRRFGCGPNFERSVNSCLGGDVYFLRNGNIEVAYANWHTDRRAGDELDDFVIRSCQHTEEYIEAFPRRTDESPLFVLVVPSH